MENSIQIQYMDVTHEFDNARLDRYTVQIDRGSLLQAIKDPLCGLIRCRRVTATQRNCASPSVGSSEQDDRRVE